MSYILKFLSTRKSPAGIRKTSRLFSTETSMLPRFSHLCSESNPLPVRDLRPTAVNLSGRKWTATLKHSWTKYDATSSRLLEATLLYLDTIQAMKRFSRSNFVPQMENIFREENFRFLYGSSKAAHIPRRADSHDAI